MNLIILIILSSFISANIILLQKKYILPEINGDEFYCIKGSIIFITIIIYIFFINKKMYKNIKNIEFKKYGPLLLFDTFLTISSIIIWYYLLHNTEAHKLISTINPLTIVLVVLLSYIFYDKKVTRNELLGILFVIIGILIINKK
jgi:uncharacterized membrane protein